MTHQTAYNEFIADFVEHHGHNRATRDEAHDHADRIVEMARSVKALCRKYADGDVAAECSGDDLIVAIVDSMEIDNKEEARFLAACVE